MKVELLGSLDYNKLSEVLKSEGIEEVKVDTLVEKIKYLEKEYKKIYFQGVDVIVEI